MPTRITTTNKFISKSDLKLFIPLLVIFTSLVATFFNLREMMAVQGERLNENHTIITEVRDILNAKIITVDINSNRLTRIETMMGIK
jgi:CHASE3 domain sensor protein